MTQHTADLPWVNRLWERLAAQALNSETLRLYLFLIVKGCLECSSHLWVSLGPKTKAAAPDSSAWTERLKDTNISP